MDAMHLVQFRGRGMVEDFDYQSRRRGRRCCTGRSRGQGTEASVQSERDAQRTAPADHGERSILLISRPLDLITIRSRDKIVLAYMNEILKCRKRFDC